MTLEELSADHARLTAQIRALETKRNLVRLAIDWKRVQGPMTLAPPRKAHDLAVADDKPTLREALLEIMREPAIPWTRDELHGELERRGWLPSGRSPKNQLGARLSTMVQRGEVARVGPATYVIRD